MRKMTLAVATLIAAIVLLVASCGNEPSAIRTVGATTTQYDLSVAVTVGNHTYIPLNIYGRPDDHLPEILGVLDAFEKRHPDLEVTSWNLLRDQQAFTTSPYIYGIWINHRPRAK